MFLAVTIRNLVGRYVLSRMVSLVICSAIAPVSKIKSKTLRTWERISEPIEKEIRK